MVAVAKSTSSNNNHFASQSKAQTILTEVTPRKVSYRKKASSLKKVVRECPSNFDTENCALRTSGDSLASDYAENALVGPNRKLSVRIPSPSHLRSDSSGYESKATTGTTVTTNGITPLSSPCRNDSPILPKVYSVIVEEASSSSSVKPEMTSNDLLPVGSCNPTYQRPANGLDWSCAKSASLQPRNSLSNYDSIEKPDAPPAWNGNGQIHGPTQTVIVNNGDHKQSPTTCDDGSDDPLPLSPTDLSPTNVPQQQSPSPLPNDTEQQLYDQQQSSSVKNQLLPVQQQQQQHQSHSTSFHQSALPVSNCRRKNCSNRSVSVKLQKHLQSLPVSLSAAFFLQNCVYSLSTLFFGASPSCYSCPFFSLTHTLNVCYLH